MAKTVAELVVNLRAETARFRRDMNAAAQTSQQVGRQINSAVSGLKSGFDNLTRAAGGFIAAWAGVRLIQAARDAIAFGAAINDVATSVGISTDALQELQFAAAQTGSSAEALNAGLERFARGLGQAAAGTGQLRGVLEAYNISLTDADGRTRSVEEMFHLYANAVENADSATEEIMLTTAAFGRGGTELVNTLRDGSAGLIAYREAAHDAGAIIEAEVIANAAEADDRLQALTDTLSTELTTALINLGPVLEVIVGGLALLARAANVAISAISQLADESFGVSEAQAPTDPLNRWGWDEATLGQLNRQREAIQAYRDQVTEQIAGLADNETTRAMREQLTGELRMAHDAQQALEDVLRQRGQAPDLDLTPPDVSLGGGGGGGRAASNDNAARDAIVGMDPDDTASLNRWNDALAAANDLIREHQTPLQTYTARVTELRGLMNAMTAAGLSAAEAQALINAEIAEAAVVMNDAGEAAAEANQMWTDFGNVATNAFAAATAEGANFRDVLLGIIQDLLQMASVQKWIASLFEGEGSGIGDIFSTLFGGGGVGTQSMGFLNFERAEGGPVAPGLTYLVGEQGPELFTSSRSGSIIPNDAIGGGGGLTVINNIDARQTDIGVEMRIRAAMAETERRIFAAMNRGGQESKISGRRPA